MQPLFEFLLRQGDNTLILGQRLSEWCGKAPALEEDIALANTALDLIGQTQLWLNLASEVEGQNRDANQLAYFRDAWDFRNILMVETPNCDYGFTLMRQYLFDSYQVLWLTELVNSSDSRVAAIAEKSVKEAHYHLERSRDIVIALGDGTIHSQNIMQGALDNLWPYSAEMFTSDATDIEMANRAIAPNPATLQSVWERTVRADLQQTNLTLPATDFVHLGGKDGVRHTEHLGHLLSTMQVLQRSYPGANW